VYGTKNDRVVLIATFANGRPLDSEGSPPGPMRKDQLTLFDIASVSIGEGSISFERMAGQARCCPMFNVTQVFRWGNGHFVFASERRNPWKKK